MKKQFQAESKQLLELMIHSIYSQKDVFLRELISNASDALDKRQFMALQDEKYKSGEYYIEIIVDDSKKTIKIIDNGIGMDEKDLENNLGTIAKSGTKEFIKKIKEDEEKINTIGQFGVGFYSAFIIAKRVEVVTKKLNSKGFIWKSDGVKDYEVAEYDKKDIGTEITLYLKDEEEILEFLNKNLIENLVKKYSDYVKYPIYMEVEEIGEDEKTKLVKKILNSQIALWKKDKKDIKKEEYNEFYKNKYYDFTDPLKVIHSKVEGKMGYELMLFIPKGRPFDYNSPTYKKGIDLYSKGILIDSNVDYLIPDEFNFVRGLVDSQDLNLNISREMLQKDSIVNKLIDSIEKKIQKELQTMLKKKREEYNELYDNFGRTLTFGLYNGYGVKSYLVKDLIMFKTSKEEKYKTFKEYIEDNKDNEFIYYAAGESIEKINQMPVMEKIKDKNIEVLYFLNDIDEFAIQIMREYEGIEFKSISNATLDLDTEEEKQKLEKITEDNKDLLESIKEALDQKVSDVKLTTKLKDSAVCIAATDGISLEQEKLLTQMPDGETAKSNKVLEINPEHNLFTSLSKIKDNKEQLKKYSSLLYDQAMLMEGFELDDKKNYIQLVNELLEKSLKE